MAKTRHLFLQPNSYNLIPVKKLDTYSVSVIMDLRLKNISQRFEKYQTKI